ncbi:hypothetical protein CO051_00535 [Candidatus Roizmanbacteria bacterium CG_4_9_14_0_2_um_filter_39_13]|uniref:SH3b domain-containing protein n=1 Tax=Candidatus Roizmanbacteria bacterium CG_4_9_14_0_2_um_filter_39_13 TaxID=1974839 RepID=A0A2M8F425_9BACT|nr:MAG: hypothetical protein CO051_00535 [Candidatus Roizmanbacteria bacterium CG_4_9_14_0_2_um_filter_39_13]
MKRKLIVLGILLLLFVVFVLVRFFIFDNPGKTGRLKVLSSPTAGIFIDNAAIGKTPFETRLKPGEYVIKLIPEGEDTQTVSWSGKVVVKENTLTYVSREMGTTELTSAGEMLTIVKMQSSPKGETGQVSIETEPTGAIVFLDNDEKGIAPLILDEVSSGDHELAVYLPGFFRRSQKINVVIGHVVKSAFKLGLDKTSKTLEEELDEKKKEASEPAGIDAKDSTSVEKNSDSKKSLTILETQTGYLNVRKSPSISGEKITEVSPGDTYEYTEESGGWYFIDLAEEDGWVSGDYVEVTK